MGRPSVEDPVPAYEDLYEQPPSNGRTGYSNVPGDDIESQEHEHSAHPNSVHLVVQNETQSHFHCELCERREERRERRRSKERCCTTVAVVMLIISLLIVLLLMAVLVGHGRGIRRH